MIMHEISSKPSITINPEVSSFVVKTIRRLSVNASEIELQSVKNPAAVLSYSSFNHFCISDRCFSVSNLLSYIRSMNQKEAETKESKEGETKEGEGGLLFSLHLRGLLWQSQCQDVPPSRAPSLPH